MPFIRGRYHINPIMGEALESARAAEELRAADDESPDGQGDDYEPNDQADGFASPHDDALASSGPIQRIEIEASELVPQHSGRAERGFVARVHRLPAGPANAASVGARHAVPGNAAWQHASHSSPPETHVFTDQRDLLNFLHDELAK